MEVKVVVAMKLVALGEDEDDVSCYDLNIPSFSVLIHTRISMLAHFVSGFVHFFLEGFAFFFRPVSTLYFTILHYNEHPTDNATQAPSQTTVRRWSIGCRIASRATRHASKERWRGRVPATSSM
jgi:hypothetical protein